MKRSDAIKTLTRRRDWLMRKLGDPKDYDGKSYDVAECSALNWVLEQMEIRKTIERERRKDGEKE